MSLNRSHKVSPGRDNMADTGAKNKATLCVVNHKRSISDLSADGRLLPNNNLPNIEIEDDNMDMSPLKRLQRLKQNGSLRLVPKGKHSKRTLNFPPDIRQCSGSDTSLSDRDTRAADNNSVASDASAQRSPFLGRSTHNELTVPVNERERKDSKTVHFEDEVVVDKNGNNSNSSEIINCKKDVKDSNGNLSKSDPQSPSTDKPDVQEQSNSNDTPVIEPAVKNSDDQGSKLDQKKSIDSETSEVKLASNELSPKTKGGKVKPPIPAKPNFDKKQEPKCVQNPATCPKEEKLKPKPLTLISPYSHGERIDKKNPTDAVSVQYTPIPKPVIEVQLIQRQSKSQTPSPSLKHSTMNPDDKWLSKSVEELDKPEDIYACPTSFLRDPNIKLRHSFIERYSFAEKERKALCSSIGDVQTLLRNTLVCEDEKIYSLPQPACYGDNTLKAVKKITEKYDTLQRRKLRALSFREGTKSGNYGASFSQPSSPVSPTGLCGVQPPPPPSSPPPPLSAGAYSVGSSVFEVPDGGRSPPPPPPPRKSSPSPIEEVHSNSPGVNSRDTARLDLFYHGRDTEVVVCQCLADLKFGTAVHSGSEEVKDWSHVAHTGVPVLVLNTGQGKRRRELLVILAERETGFPLWSDKINYLSNYRQLDTTTQVMQLSNNLKKVAGFTFFCEQAAQSFIEKYSEMTKNPNDDLWKVSSAESNKPKKKKRPFSFRRLRPKKLPTKTDISVPCNFSHITSVDPQDRTVFESIRSKSLPNSPTNSRPVSFANS